MSESNRTRSQAELQAEYKLVQAAQKNSRRFGVLYERYYEQIFLFVYKRVDDQELSADLCSQVFLKAMLNLKKYRFQGVPFSAWLYRIAVNEVNQFFRQNKHRRTVSLESTQLAAFMEEVEEQKGEGDMQRMVEAIRSLSDEEVQFIEMRYFEKIPFKEVAAIYNITENNAKVRMYRLLAKLRKRMQTSAIEA